MVVAVLRGDTRAEQQRHGRKQGENEQARLHGHDVDPPGRDLGKSQFLF
jgi:hypothetical protein